jgi:hypothetical protein
MTLACCEPPLARQPYIRFVLQGIQQSFGSRQERRTREHGGIHCNDDLTRSRRTAGAIPER